MSRPLSCDPRFAGVSFAGTPSSRHRHFAAREPRPAVKTCADIRCPGLDRAQGLEIPETEETAFLRRVLSLGGLDPGRYRMAPLLRRLPACLRALRAVSLHEARHRLEADGCQLRAALGTLLIGTTSFFRDSGVFRDLQQLVIPALLQRQPKPRVWSAACSDGAELHSVAMLLASLGALAPGHLLGTDFRARAVEAAAAGRYPAEAALGVPADLVSRFLVPGDNSVSVAAVIRDALAWERRDVFSTAPSPGSWDLILCRNLAIYLAPPAVELLWKRLAAALAPGGILVVGKAEKPRIPGLDRLAPCIYRHQPSP
jgi:chemotaxis protein methyltransferase CheR